MEMEAISENREKLPIALFLPSKETVRICLNKLESYKRWEEAGIKQPKTMLINGENDLTLAFAKFGNKIWLRDTTGAGGRGSLPATDFKVAKSWLDFKEGWGKYTAAECLEPNSVTWMSIWNEGELVVAQGRERLYWELSKISPSGVTGATGGGVTMSDPLVDDIAMKAVFAIDKKPNGIFSVDLTYDNTGIPCPTEINIGRFFTTHEFFTRAGLNMPYLFVKMAFGETVTAPEKRINPLPTDLVWIRGMDFLPVLTTSKKIEEAEITLELRRQRINSQSKKILVTGVTGHIGLELFKTLEERGYDVTALLRGSNEEATAFLQQHSPPFMVCDLSNKLEVAAQAKTLSQFTHVIHCAGYVPKKAAEDDLKRCMDGNLVATINLVETLAKNTHFIYLSTCEVYGPTEMPLFEHHPLNPKSHYGMSKMMAENILQLYSARNALALTILRLTNIYGPGEKIERAIPNFISAVLRGENPVIYGDGTDIRDVLFISDAAEYVIAALEKKKEGIFNIASGRKVSILELAEKIITLSGEKVNIRFEPRSKMKVNFRFDVSRAQQELGYLPTVSLERGLQKEIEWYNSKQ